MGAVATGGKVMGVLGMGGGLKGFGGEELARE